MPSFGFGPPLVTMRSNLLARAEGEDGRALVIVQARFLDQRLVAEADAEAAGRHA